MVAPFLVPLRKWIKRNKKGRKTAKGMEKVASDIGVPGQVDAKQDVSSEPDLEISSRALKLLLGVSDDAPVRSKEHENRLPTRLDLTTLFQQPGSQHAANTDGFPARHTPNMLSLQDLERNSFVSPLEQTADRSYLRPDQSHLTSPRTNFDAHSQPPIPKINPNAQSLLALLSPGASKTADPTDMFIHLPPMQPDHSTRQRLPMPKPPEDTIGPTGHKQSLLSILKPTIQTPSPRALEQDNFLMQYLLNATQNAR